MRIPVTEWMPDAASLDNPGSVVVTNALPGTNSYKPMPAFEALTNALDNRARGTIDVRDKENNTYQFAGDEEKLYELSTISWGDVSKVGGYSTGEAESWDFVQWKNQVLATNFSDNIQYIDLGGTNFSNLTTAFKCRHLAVIADYVVAANTFDATDGFVPDRIRTCAFNDATDWTTSTLTGSIARDLKGGAINQVFGGQYGVILGENHTYRMDFVGAPTWFQITQTLPGVGLIARGAATRIGDQVFAWTNQGFLAISSATGYEPIGAGKVDRYAMMDLDDAYLDRITTAADPRSGRIFWGYPGAGSTDGQPNKILCYDKNFGRWSLIEQEFQILWPAGGIGFTLEDLDAIYPDIDAMPVSLDSSQWQGGGQVLLGAFDASNQHGFFSGPPMQATIDTREIEPFPGSTAFVTACRPLVDGGTVTVQSGYRNKQGDGPVWSLTKSTDTRGVAHLRSNGRYHRFRLTVAPDTAWTDLIGVELDRKDVRKAGFRG